MKKIRHLGGIKEINIDLRTISATNRNLEKLLAEGRFREDLFYRLHEIPLEIPPLRERKEDIIYLADHFLKRINGSSKHHFVLSEKVVNILMKYEWMGNVRQLQNALKYATSMASEDLITESDLPDYFSSHDKDLSRANKLKDVVKEAESKAIKEALNMYGSSTEAKKEVANAFGIGLSTLYKKLKKF